MKIDSLPIKALALLMVLFTLPLSGCTSSEPITPIEDPCIASRAAAEDTLETLQELDPKSSLAKVNLLTWAYLVTEEPQCFSAELVAQAKTAINLAN